MNTAKKAWKRRTSLLQERHDSEEEDEDLNFDQACKRAGLLKVFGVTAAKEPTSGRRIFYNPEQSSADLNVSNQLDKLSERRK